MTWHKFNVFHPEVLQHVNTNMSANDTTIYFIYNKTSILLAARIWDPAMNWNIVLGSVSQRAWRWPSEGRNMSPWQYTIFIVYKINCCVIDWHVCIYEMQCVTLSQLTFRYAWMFIIVFTKVHVHNLNLFLYDQFLPSEPNVHKTCTKAVTPYVEDNCQRLL